MLKFVMDQVRNVSRENFQRQTDLDRGIIVIFLLQSFNLLIVSMH